MTSFSDLDIEIREKVADDFASWMETGNQPANPYTGMCAEHYERVFDEMIADYNQHIDSQADLNDYINETA